MSSHIRRVDYFYTTVQDQPGEAHKVLAMLADVGVNLVAMASIPVGPSRTQLTLFPDNSDHLVGVGTSAGMELDGPHPALLVQGTDEVGAISEVHAKLSGAGVNVFASTGVTDGGGSFGYVLYVRPEQYQLATSTLGI